MCILSFGHFRVLQTHGGSVPYTGSSWTGRKPFHFPNGGIGYKLILFKRPSAMASPSSTKRRDALFWLDPRFVVVAVMPSVRGVSSTDIVRRPVNRAGAKCPHHGQKRFWVYLIGAAPPNILMSATTSRLSQDGVDEESRKTASTKRLLLWYCRKRTTKRRPRLFQLLAPPPAAAPKQKIKMNVQ
jgi:hypothetical protein